MSKQNTDFKVALQTAYDALDAAEEYFDRRQDADCDQDGFVPNEEMRLLSVVSSALNVLQPLLAREPELAMLDPENGGEA